MSKGEERCDFSALIVPVADVETFAVDDGQVLAGPVVVGRSVLKTTWECALTWFPK